MKIIDASSNVTGHVHELKANGVTDVGRYIALGEEREEKVIKPAEAKAIAEVGLRLFLIYEANGHPTGSVDGERSGAYALQYAKEVGAPKGAVIYATVDFDPRTQNMPGIIAWFEAFNKALGGYFQLGCYGSGMVCHELYRRGLINHRWITMSMGFTGSRSAVINGQYEMLQGLPTRVAGVSCDPNTLKAGTEFGSFVPFYAPAPPAPKPEPTPAPTPSPWQCQVMCFLHNLAIWIFNFVK